MERLRGSRLLRRKIALVSSGLDSVAAALWDHPHFAQVYPNYLFTNHAVVRSSVPLMRSALQRARGSLGNDPVAQGLADYLERHIPEEMHHADRLIEDLEVLGVRRSSVVERAPSRSVATLVGSQYYWILHFHPIALLGYIAVLEGTPPEEERIQSVAARTGVPLNAFSTLVRHARLDPYHRDDLDLVLDALPLTDAHHALLGVSAFHTVCWLARVVEEAITATPGTAMPSPSISSPRDTPAPATR
jgi:hypothetical protein